MTFPGLGTFLALEGIAIRHCHCSICLRVSSYFDNGQNLRNNEAVTCDHMPQNKGSPKLSTSHVYLQQTYCALFFLALKMHEALADDDRNGTRTHTQLFYPNINNWRNRYPRTDASIIRQSMLLQSAKVAKMSSNTAAPERKRRKVRKET